jgi:hypothetical protein
MRRFQRYLQQGKRTSGRRSNRVKAENVPKWARPSLENIWESGWEVRDGAGKRAMECEMCTENDKEGRGWERQWQ